MKRGFLWLVLVGSVLVVVGVLWQDLPIAAYVRGAGDGALDAHGAGSMVVHLGQLSIVIGSIVVWWGNWKAVGLAIAFLVLSIAQLGFLGDTEKEGSWVNGLHGFLALVVLIAALGYLDAATRSLGMRAKPAQPS
jgi:hypothetical protein